MSDLWPSNAISLTGFNLQPHPPNSENPISLLIVNLQFVSGKHTQNSNSKLSHALIEFLVKVRPHLGISLAGEMWNSLASGETTESHAGAGDWEKVKLSLSERVFNSTLNSLNGTPIRIRPLLNSQFSTKDYWINSKFKEINPTQNPNRKTHVFSPKKN